MALRTWQILIFHPAYGFEDVVLLVLPLIDIEPMHKYDVDPEPVLHWYNSCQEISDRGWSKKSDISGGALY